MVGHVFAGISIAFSRKDNDIYFSNEERTFDITINRKLIIDFFEKIDELNIEYSIKFEGFKIKIAKFPFGGVVLLVSPQVFPHVSSSSFVFSIDEFWSFKERLLALCKIEI